MKKICVFGTYKNLGKKKKDEIAKLGRLLAEKGIVVVSGGFGGSMEDVSRGAKSAGGRTIGVTYYRHEDASKSANPYIDEEIRTKDIFSRITKMMEIADGFIALEGGTGTLLELAAVMEHINKGTIPPKPIVAIGNFWRPVVKNLRGEDILSQGAKKKLNIDNCGGLVTFAKDAEDAVRKISEKI